MTLNYITLSTPIEGAVQTSFSLAPGIWQVSLELGAPVIYGFKLQFDEGQPYLATPLVTLGGPGTSTPLQGGGTLVSTSLSVIAASQL